MQIAATTNSIRNLLYGCLAFIVTFIFANAFFGFDYSDEGYSMLLTSRFQPPGNEVTLFPTFLRPISTAFGLGIVEFRIIRLLIHIITSFILVSALKYFCLHFRFVWQNYFTPFILITSFTIYLLFPNNISYNTVAYNLIQLMAAALIYHFSALLVHPSRLAYLSPVVLSLITVPLFYAKISSALTMSLLIIGLWCVLIIAGIRRKQLIISIIGFSSLTALWFALMEMNSAYPPSRLVEQIKTINTLQTTHSTADLLSNFGSFVLLAATLILLGVHTSRKFAVSSYKQTIAFLLLTAVIVFAASPHIGKESYIKHISAALLFSIGVSVHYITRQKSKQNFPLMILVFILFGAAITSFIGTNNSNLLVFVISSGIVLPIAILSVKENYIRTYAMITSGCTIALIVILLVFFPYRQPPMYTMNTWVKPPVGSAFLMDPTDATDLDMIRTTLHEIGFQPGDPIFAPFRLPGLVYLLDGYSPGGILWSDTHMPAYMNRLRLDFQKQCDPCILIARNHNEAIEFLSFTHYNVTASIANSSNHHIYKIEGDAYASEKTNELLK